LILFGIRKPVSVCIPVHESRTCHPFFISVTSDATEQLGGAFVTTVALQMADPYGFVAVSIYSVVELTGGILSIEPLCTPYDVTFHIPLFRVIPEALRVVHENVACVPFAIGVGFIERLQRGVGGSSVSANREK
jgi:hypothetical protein